MLPCLDRHARLYIKHGKKHGYAAVIRYEDCDDAETFTITLQRKKNLKDNSGGMFH